MNLIKSPQNPPGTPIFSSQPPPEGILRPQNPGRRLSEAPRAHAQRLGLRKRHVPNVGPVQRLGKTHQVWMVYLEHQVENDLEITGESYVLSGKTVEHHWKGWSF